MFYFNETPTNQIVISMIFKYIVPFSVTYMLFKKNNCYIKASQFLNKTASLFFRWHFGLPADFQWPMARSDPLGHGIVQFCEAFANSGCSRPFFRDIGVQHDVWRLLHVYWVLTNNRGTPVFAVNLSVASAVVFEAPRSSQLARFFFPWSSQRYREPPNGF